MTTKAVAEYISTRQIGDATVTIFNEGTLDWAPHYPVPEADWRAAMPEATESGQVTLGLHVVHVKIGDASILLDPGCDEPDSEWNDEFSGRFDAVTRTPGLVGALAHLGIAPEVITHVVITHGHGDHVAGLAVLQDGKRIPRFPNARHFIGKADWDDNPQRMKPETELARYVGTVAAAGLLETVDREREIAPGVTVIPTPGETRGHLAVRVDSNGERFFYVGDLIHHAAEVAHVDWISPGRDQAAMIASRQRLIDESVPTGALCLYTHHQFPGWGRIVADNGGYRWVRA
ncbi:MAG TPA: MBL fold metallo-hydrolase [Nitrolancea sp.]|nr:MBL fold metallo-hydrolase [Nitrolancea sp.]